MEAVVRVVLSTYDSRGGIEPYLALAVQLRELGAEAVICAPPDCAERIAEVGVPLVQVGRPVHSLVHGPTRPTADDVPRIAAELMAAQFDAVRPAAEGCDVIVTSGVMSVVAAVRSVAESLGVPSVLASYCPVVLPSPHHRPMPLPGHALPANVTDPRELDALSAASYTALFGGPLNACRATVGLPPVDDVRAHILGDRIWLAADPTLAPWRTPAYVDVVQTGAWLLPDTRPLPAALEEFLDAGSPPVYVGFGSVRAPDGIAELALDAVRAHGRRIVVSRGWSDLAPIDDGDDCVTVGEVNQQALFTRVAAVVHHAGAGTTHAAARAGVPQVVVPQIGDQPYWGQRVAALGIGWAHDGPVPTRSSLTAALETALRPEPKARATALSRQIRTDGAEVAARLLRAVVGSR